MPAIWGLRELDAFLLVVDDVPWGGAFNPALTALDLHDVERIEVMRGAAPVVDASIGYRFDGWELRLAGYNLTDSRDPVSESELGDGQYYRMPARAFELGAIFDL